MRTLKIIASVVLVLAAGCGGKPAPSQPSQAETPSDAAAAPASGANQLSNIEVKDTGGATQLIISGSQPMSPNIFKLTDPDRIIIDLTNTTLGSLKGPIAVNSGGVGQVTVDQFDDGTSSLSRVVVGLDQPLEYEVQSDQNKLVVSVHRLGGSPPSNSPSGLPELPSAPVAESTPPPAEAPQTPMDPALPPLPVGPETAAPESLAPAGEPQAKELVDIQYSSSGSGTSVTLVTDGSIADYADFVLKNPERLVIDLKGVKNSYPGGKAISLNTGEVKQIRLGNSKGSVRIVMDLVHSEKPAYSISKDGKTLAIAVSVSTAPTAEEAPAEAPAPAGELPMAAEAPTGDSMAAAPVPSGKTVYVTGVAFKQIKETNKSRVTIGLSEPTSNYSEREDGPGRIVIEINNAKLKRKILSREFNTKEFKTAILKIAPKEDRQAKTVEFMVELEQQMPHILTQEGNNLVLDVDIPDQVLRKQTPTVSKKGPATDAAAATETPSEETVAEPSTDSSSPSKAGMEQSGSQKEMMMASDQMSPTAESPTATKKNYRFVKEGFMSDSTATGEPLSEMGAILAGDYRGKRFTGRRISLDFKDAEIRSIFRLLADISKLNLIISDDVGGRVTVRLENVPWDQAFAIILQTKGLWFEKYGNIVRIAPADKLRAEKELAAAAEKASQAAKPMDVLFKPVSYATGGDLMKQVKSVLSDRGNVDFDGRTNTLIIKDIRENLEKARRLVDILDTQTPQITIESRIVEANTNYTRSFGVVWGGRANFSSATGNPTGLFFPNSANIQGIGAGAGTASFSGLPVALNYPSPLGTNAGVGIRFGSINNILDLDLALGLLETQGHAKLISSPKVTVLNNESANITAGSKIPFLTQTANAGSNVRFESAATSLGVTPQATNDGSVLLTISATRSEPNFAQLVQGNPLVDQRSATTKVLVKSGNTTVLGGIYSIRTGSTRDSLPGISNIPIIGWLFKNYNKELRRAELLIFVTPRIVGDEREAVKDIRG
jgi:type IV pilus assembly protein PilQ